MNVADDDESQIDRMIINTINPTAAPMIEPIMNHDHGIKSMFRSVGNLDNVI